MDMNPNENLPASNPVSVNASPASDSSSSDSEACNTASSRVHFGPLRSPEKKFVPLISHRQTLRPTALNSLLQLSARVTMPAITLPLCNTLQGRTDDEDEVADEIPSRSRSGTPENDRFPPDEPSSVLATRIIRAHDNPSPPPRSHEHSYIVASSNKDAAFPLIDVSESPSPLSPSVHTRGRQDQFTFVHPRSIPLSPTPLPHRQDLILPSLFVSSVSRSSSPQPEPTVATTSQHDLITFDFFSAPSADMLNPDPSTIAGPSTASRQLLTQTAHPTSVDDLLSRSPTTSSQNCPIDVPHLQRERSPPIPLLSAPQSDKSREAEESPSDIEEQAVEVALSLNIAEDSSEALSLSRLVVSPSRQEGNGDGEKQHTPLRRSTRPRRSVSPFTFRTDNAAVEEPQWTSKAAEARTPLPGHRHVLAIPSSGQTQRKKSKERSISPGNEVAAGSQGSNRGGSASEEADRVEEGSTTLWVVGESTSEPEQESPKSRGKRRDEGKIDSGGRTDEESALRRELGSLSPSSANVLTNLLACVNASPEMKLDLPLDETVLADPTTPQPPALSFSVFPLRQLSAQTFQTPSRSRSPNRFPSPRRTSPIRFAVQRSPARQQPPDLDDPNRTPARRIPLGQAVAQGQISLQKAVQLASRPAPNSLATGASLGMGPLRAPVFSLRPEMDSPARRIPISEATPVKSRGPRLGSPVRVMSRERSRSAEPKTLETGDKKGRNAHVEHPKPPTIVEEDRLLVASGSKLPFALVPAPEPPIPEGGQTRHSGTGGSVTSNSTAMTSASPGKSVLRELATGSRIPRMGVKPYSKPTASATTRNANAREGRIPGVMRRVDLTAKVDAAKASNVSRVVSTPSTAAGSNINSVTSGGTALRPTTASSHGITTIGSSTSPNLKRKRGEIPTSHEKGTSIRIPGQVGVRQLDLKHPFGRNDLSKSSPVKKQAPFISRRVVDHHLSEGTDKEVANGHLKEIAQVNESGTSELSVTSRQETERNDLLTADSCANFVPPSSTDDAPSPISREDALGKESTSEFSSPSASNGKHAGRIRRTTRPRKPTQSNTTVDVFGTVDVQPLLLRRKVASVRAETFSGMSAVALKALTSSNTTKNQRYIAAKLETEVIHKEGARPDSPTVKVKTILQRREEEKSKQRKERAERRARRSDEGSGFSDIEGQSNQGDSSTIEMGSDWDREGQDHYAAEPLLKHRRGPGDEEDYETPDKQERPTKRLRPGEEDIGGVKKRVKWDRGLSTAIYLDQVQPRTRANPNKVVTMKGCLAKTAKAIRLDTLGNLPNADTPLTDLVYENIVVKKFVYDNDPEPPTPVLVVKNTRSRSKKMKT